MNRRAGPAIKHQQGLSLIELLIGSALGVLLVGAGIGVLMAHLKESRALVEHNRLMQDLRSTTSLIARDLRRAGHWADSGAGVWLRDSPPPDRTVAANPYAAIDTTSAPAGALTLRYSRDSIENHSVDSNEQFGFRLRNQVIEMRLGSSSWQAMTDASLMKVTALEFTPSETVIDLGALCSADCAEGDAACPPRQKLRSVIVTVTARSAADAGAVRTARAEVRLRNDEITGRCPV
jgi:prepilin peptidase dependent protein B